MKTGIQNTVEILEQVQQLESTLGLKNEACRSKFLIHPDLMKLVVPNF